MKTAELEREAATAPWVLIREARRRQRRRYLAAGVVAATMAAAVGAGISQAGPGGRSSGESPRTSLNDRPPAYLGDGPPDYSTAPVDYAYTAQRTISRITTDGGHDSMFTDGWVKIRATGTGKLLATINGWPYSNFSQLTADASGRTFVFAAQRYRMRNVPPPPKSDPRDARIPMKFLLVHLTPRGGVQRAWLSLPETLTPGQHPTIALSPTGTKLAVAFGGGHQPATVQVITLATGQVRQWNSHRRWTPVIAGNGTWTADGRQLLFQQQIAPEVYPQTTIRVRLLDTAVPGASLAASKLLILHQTARYPDLTQPFLTPDGTTLISAVSRESRKQGPFAGALATYSASTGALLHTMSPWTWHWPAPPAHGGFPLQPVVWTDRAGTQVVTLQPRNDLNHLGVLSGDTFGQAGRNLLPRQPAGYQELQYSVRETDQMTW
jgi:hypothetical protein